MGTDLIFQTKYVTRSKKGTKTHVRCAQETRPKNIEVFSIIFSWNLTAFPT
jgi:hypothetical protein